MVEELLRLRESREVYPTNLGNPIELSILQFAELIRDRFDNSIGIQHKPLPSDDSKIRRPDIEKARRVLGWDLRVGLDEGLTLMIDFFRNQVASDALHTFSSSILQVAN